MNTATLFPNAGRDWWLLVIYGVIAILFGLMALVRPFDAALSLAWALGIVALVEGVVGLVAAFRRNAEVSRGWLIAYAVLSILFGLVAVLFPGVVAGALLLLLAAWLVVAGIFRIVFAIRVRNYIKGEWLLIISGILAIVLGGLLAAYPLAGLLAAMVWVAVAAIVYGVLQLVAGFRVRRQLKTPA